MNVLLINHFPLVGSGSGVYITNIAKGLVEAGNKVCIIMPENTTKILSIPNVKIHPVFFFRDEKIDGQINFNFPCMDPHPRSSFLFNNMTPSQIKQYESAFRIAIEEELNKFKPDIIHSQHIWIISGLLKDYKVPYIITSHGAEFITYNKTDIFDKYGISAVEHASKIITISNDNTTDIINKFPNSKDKITFIKNSYNSKNFFIENLDKKNILKNFGINENFDKIILFVGRVSKMKGLDTLIKAAKIYESEKTLTLIVGDGSYKDELINLISDLNLQNIVFLGSKSHEDLRLLYNIADVLVLPSRKEALPLVAIEALACGTPAIVTNQSGMDAIITKDVGLVFDMDNEKMLAEKINSILSKEIIFDKFKLSNYAKANYSQEIFMDKLLKLYNEIRR